MSHTPDPDSLQAPRADRWWAAVSLGLLAAVSISAAVVCIRLLRIPPPPAAAVDHGPLPPAVRAQVMALLAEDLKDARLEERWEGGVRDFLVMGTPRPEFAKAFTDRFKPDVSSRLLPLLRPYGEIVSFDIYNYDYAPVRLRALPQAPAAPLKAQAPAAP